MPTETHDTAEWYDNRANLADTAEWMLERDWDYTEVITMLRRPWKYADLWDECRTYNEGRNAAIEDLRETSSLV